VRCVTQEKTNYQTEFIDKKKQHGSIPEKVLPFNKGIYAKCKNSGN
jgi:hypothetical protein